MTRKERAAVETILQRLRNEYVGQPRSRRLCTQVANDLKALLA